MPAAVDDHDVDLDRARRASTPSAVSRAPAATRSPSGTPGGLALLQRVERGVGAAHPRDQLGRAAGVADQARPATPVDTCERPECRSRWPSASLDSLPMPPAIGQPRDRVAAQVLEHRAGEVAHVEQRVLGQPVAARRPPAREVRAGAAGDVLVTGRAGDVDAAADRVDPRRARVRDDDAGRARGSTARRGCRAAGSRSCRASSSPCSTEISTTTSPVPPCRAATAATCSRIICRGIGLIAGSPTASGRPGLGDRADALARRGRSRRAGLAAASPRAETSAPWVTSGSSPASLTTPAVAAPSLERARAPARTTGCCRSGRSIVTGSGNSPVSSAV